MTVTQESSNIAKYQCPICEFEATKEGIVRAHMSHSTDSDHQLEYIYMPETKVNGLSDSGEIIERIGGRSQLQRLDEIDVSNLSSVTSDQDEFIVQTAVKNPHKSFSEIKEQVNEEIATGTYGYSSSKLDYNTVYSIIVEALDIQRKSHERDSSKNESKMFEDLTEKQQSVIEVYAEDPDQDNKSIAEKAGVSNTYPQQVLDDYGHIAQSYKRKLMSQQYDIPEDREYSNLTELQFEVLDTIARDPTKSNEEVAEQVDCDSRYPKKVREQYQDAIHNRRVDIGLEEPDDETGDNVESEPEPEVERNTQDDDTEVINAEYARYEVPSSVAEEYNDLTPKQEAVVNELAAEQDPESPDRTHDVLSEHAGTHETYVYMVKDEYIDLIKDIQSGTKVETIKDTPSPKPSYAEPEGDEISDETFPERLAEAVKANDVKAIQVRDIRSNITKVDSASVIEQAIEQDDRKTALSSYQDRLERISTEESTQEETTEVSTQETTTEQETQETVQTNTQETTTEQKTSEASAQETTEQESIQASTQDTVTGQEATQTDSRTSTESTVADESSPSPSSQSQEKLESVYNQIQMMYKTTEAEIENGNTNASVVAKNAVAKTIKEDLEEIVEN
jgi:hypothetical protein